MISSAKSFFFFWSTSGQNIRRSDYRIVGEAAFDTVSIQGACGVSRAI